MSGRHAAGRRRSAKARVLEGILSHNPDVLAYVRRTGSENGLYATQLNRGDIEVVLRPDEDDPVSLVTKPVRPPLDQLEKELKKQGKKLDDKERENIRRKYRRRSTDAVMDEIADAIADQFAEHQLKTEMVQVMQDEMADLSGASRPIEVQLLGPDQATLRQLAQDVADNLAAKGKGRGLQEVASNVYEGNPDLMIRVDEEAGRPHGLQAGRGAAANGGDVRGPDRGPGAGVVAAHHRRARPLSRRPAIRSRKRGERRFDPGSG